MALTTWIGSQLVNGVAASSAAFRDFVLDAYYATTTGGATIASIKQRISRASNVKFAKRKGAAAKTRLVRYGRSWGSEM